MDLRRAKTVTVNLLLFLKRLKILGLEHQRGQSAIDPNNTHLHYTRSRTQKPRIRIRYTE